MDLQQRTLVRAAGILSGGSAVAVLFSIAISHILLASALLTLAAARARLRLPPIKLPLALFVAFTLVSLAFSPDPAAGLPQIKKFFVFGALIAIYSTFRRVDDFRIVTLAWGALAAASGLWSFVQFWQKRSTALAAGHDFYLAYVGDRVTGFMSHWMTFSAEQMMAGLMLAALLMFGAVRNHRALACIGLAIIGGSLVIAWTRGVWLASAVAGLYLIAVWRPKLLLLLPAVLPILWFAAPVTVRQRIVSIYRPHGQTDSNDHRRILMRTGVEIIKAHPWTGVGPEMIKRDFHSYVPADIPRPLPEAFYEHLHNVYMQYAAERGIPALLAFVWLIAKIIADLARAVRRLQPHDVLPRAMLHGSLAGIIAILVEAFFEHNLGDSEVLTMFLFVVAAGYVAAEQREPQHA
jgi:O-antigen ligase